jgi:uncharacterized protein (TIGR02453 family)
MDFPPFPGFRQEAFDFLRALAQNNERDWFKPRKDVYEDEVLWPFRCLVADVTREARAQGVPLAGDPASAIFRIYRDTRFSKDKRPYKTHAGAFLTRTGDREVHGGGFYIHVEPGQCFLGAGSWRPEPKVLRRWRTCIAADPATFLDMAARLEAAGLAFECDGELLKRHPAGFDVDPDAPVAPYLRWKSFLATRRVADDALQDPGFTHAVVQTMRDALPLLEYGWELE